MRIPLGPWLPDKNPLELAGLVRVENAVPMLDGYRSMRDTKLVPGLSSLSGKVIGAGRGRTLNGVPFIVAGKEASLSLLQGVNWVAHTHSPAYAVQGQPWRFALYANILIAANINQRCQIYDFGAGSPAWADLSADASIAQHAATCGEFVVLANIKGQGVNATTIGTAEAGLHWCAIGDPTNWPQVGTQAALDVQSDFNILPGDGGPITDIVAVGEWYIVTRERETWRMDYVGSPNIFTFRQLSAKRGCNHQGAVLSVGGLAYFPAEDGFAVCDGSTVESIGEEQIDRWWQARADKTLPLSKAQDGSHNILLWTVPGTDLILCYQYDIKQWSTIRKSVDWLLTSVGGFSAGSVQNLDALNLNMDVAAPTGLGDVNLDASSVTNDDELLCAFLPDGYLYAFTGGAMTAVFETGDFVDANMLKSYVRNARPLITSTANVSLALAQRERPWDEVNFGSPAALNRLGVFPLRVCGRFLRGQLTVGADASTPETGFLAKGLEVNAQPMRYR